MAGKRRYRRSFKRRRTSRRRGMRGMRRRTPRYNGVTNISRAVNLVPTTGFTTDGTWLQETSGYLTMTTSSSAGGLTFGSFAASFRLSDVPDYTEFTNLFDQFRLNKVVIRIIPMATSVSTGAAYASNVGQSCVLFHWALDQDDQTLPTNSESGVDTMRNRQGYRVRNIYSGGGRPITIVFRPHFARTLYNTSTTSAYQPARGWLDNNSSGTPHYGLKCITEAVSGGSVQVLFFKIEAKYFFSFKGIE